MSIQSLPVPPARPLGPARRAASVLPQRLGWAVAATVLVAVTVFEARQHGGGVSAAAVFGGIGPDLTFLLAIGAGPTPHGVLPRRVVRPYNLAHHPLPPGLLLVAGALLPGAPVAFVLALGWLAHITLDRALGYGPRAADGSFAR